MHGMAGHGQRKAAERDDGIDNSFLFLALPLEGMKDGLRMSNWGGWRAGFSGGCAGGRRNTSVIEDR
jgi:hypothetical protein